MGMNDTRVRRARRSDVKAIERLVRDAFGKYTGRIGRAPAPMAADYDHAVQTSRVWVLETVADQPDPPRIVGVVVTENLGDHLLLDSIAVDPDEQGRGYGARLMARADQDARDLGLPEIRLCTNKSMTENLVFYPRHGYTETARARQDGYDRVFFAKPVPPQTKR
jgi:N-acetylglutamate synthase-like GNAT family acetyltransferase